MRKLLVSFLLVLVGLQALAKIQIPFQKISLKPVYEVEAVVQTPLAVAPSRFAVEVDKDCRDFSNTLQLLQARSMQIQDSDYDEIRFRALPLSMKANFEIQLLADKSINLEPAFESAKIVNHELVLKFLQDAKTPKQMQKTATRYISALDSAEQSYVVLQFKSRDLFCDYFFGKLQIYTRSDLQLKTNLKLQLETEDKLQKVLNGLNESLKLNMSLKTKAAFLGMQMRTSFQSNLKETLREIFSNLVNIETLEPKSFWVEHQAGFYVLNFKELHNISEQMIFWKGKFHE